MIRSVKLGIRTPRRISRTPSILNHTSNKRALSPGPHVRINRRLSLHHRIKMTSQRHRRRTIRLHLERQRNTIRLSKILHHRSRRQNQSHINSTVSHSHTLLRSLRRDKLNTQQNAISLINRSSTHGSQSQIRLRTTVTLIGSESSHSITKRRIKHRLSTIPARPRHNHRTTHRKNLPSPKRVLRRRITLNRRTHSHRFSSLPLSLSRPNSIISSNDNIRLGLAYFFNHRHRSNGPEQRSYSHQSLQPYQGNPTPQTN